MLTAPLISRRLLLTPWRFGSTSFVRCASSNSSNEPGAGSREKKLWRQRQAIKRRDAQSVAGELKSLDNPSQGAKTPSLIEQLFPEETKRFEEQQRKASREIPRLPLDSEPFTPFAPLVPREGHIAEDGLPRSPKAQRLYDDLRRQDSSTPEASILVLRNASPNLTEEDFRRLIPQGKHMEGWTLEQGDILKVIPGRDLATLEQQNYYYLLFSSRLSAFTYQGHVTRIFRMVQAHTPSSLASPIPPPPGYVVDGMEPHAAIAAFALIPPSQNLELRQLQPPLSPMMESIVRNQGYSSILHRLDRMPHEVRLTLEGPQLYLSQIRHVLLSTAQDRSFPWSGGDEVLPRIANWEPRPTISPQSRSGRAEYIKATNERTEEDQLQKDLERQRGAREGKDRKEITRRAPGSVWVVGFHTEAAAQGFVRYWHRRPMVGKVDDGKEQEEEDLPPVASVEMLW